MSMIRNQMPHDHKPDECEICKFLAKPCSNCNQLHANYEEAAACMHVDFATANQYTQAMRKHWSV